MSNINVQCKITQKPGGSHLKVSYKNSALKSFTKIVGKPCAEVFLIKCQVQRMQLY